MNTIPILMYHNISTLPAGITRNRGLYVTPSRFAQQMRWLQRFGYRGLSMSDAMPYLSGQKQGKVAVITLDDGYVDNLESALPTLTACGFTATCYAVSGCLGEYNLWDAEKLGVRKPVMSAAQLRAWQAGGMEVGAHTQSHPHLDQCDAATLEAEIIGGKRELETAIDAPITQFCYPYGSLNAEVAAVARRAGFAAATTTRHGRARVGDDLWLLPRVPITYRYGLLRFLRSSFTAYEDRRGQRQG